MMMHGNYTKLTKTPGYDISKKKIISYYENKRGVNSIMQIAWNNNNCLNQFYFLVEKKEEKNKLVIFTFCWA